MILNFRCLLPAICIVALLVTSPMLAQTVTPQVTQEPESATAPTAPEVSESLPLVYETDFENGIDDWQPIDDGWKTQLRNDTHVLSQFKKESNYKPKVRSPFHLALLKNHVVGDFQLNARVLSTHPDYNHRDACLFFGYQSPTQFYYVHLGKSTDPHANQIFIVNNVERTKISLTTTEGTNWDDQWHDVRIDRNIETGEIAVYFDDMEQPVMTANDKTFLSGQIGLGSFDDTADWDDVSLNGTKVDPVKE